MSQRMRNKVVLISGGASGIGASHARVFATEGAKVLIGDIQDKLGEQVVSQIVSEGYEAAYTHLDVADADSWNAAVALALEKYGTLTTLINNAGIYHPGGVEDETPSKWDRMVSINQKGVWLGMRAAAPSLRSSGNAAIVNISSVFGIVGSPGNISYHATKGAVRMMSKSAALEFAKSGIRVNSVHPGQILTPILAGLTPEEDKAIKAAIPMGVIGEPEDIAYGSLFLCSDEAKYITGIELCIDAGWTA